MFWLADYNPGKVRGEKAVHGMECGSKSVPRSGGDWKMDFPPSFFRSKTSNSFIGTNPFGKWAKRGEAGQKNGRPPKRKCDQHFPSLCKYPIIVVFFVWLGWLRGYPLNRAAEQQKGNATSNWEGPADWTSARRVFCCHCTDGL